MGDKLRERDVQNKVSKTGEQVFRIRAKKKFGQRSTQNRGAVNIIF